MLVSDKLWCIRGHLSFLASQWNVFRQNNDEYVFSPVVCFQFHVFILFYCRTTCAYPQTSGSHSNKSFHVSPLQEKEERYLMLFPNVLVMLSASPRMSGFIYQVRCTIPPKPPLLWVTCIFHFYGHNTSNSNNLKRWQDIIFPILISSCFCSIQGRLPLTGTTVTRHAEDTDSAHYAFDITGLNPKCWRKGVLLFSLAKDTAIMHCNSNNLRSSVSSMNSHGTVSSKVKI